MARTYACIISPDVKRDKEPLIAAAREFAYSIEVLDDGILFDVSGLERLIGKPDKITQKILTELERRKISGSVAVARTVDTAILLARQKGVGGQTADERMRSSSFHYAISILARTRSMFSATLGFAAFRICWRYRVRS